MYQNASSPSNRYSTFQPASTSTTYGQSSLGIYSTVSSPQPSYAQQYSSAQQSSFG